MAAELGLNSLAPGGMYGRGLLPPVVPMLSIF